MMIATCTLELYLPMAHSLKAKRGRLKPLMARLRREFNVAVAEIDYHDVWQTAAIAVVTVSTEGGHAQALLERVVHYIEHHFPDVDVTDHHIELR